VEVQIRNVETRPKLIWRCLRRELQVLRKQLIKEHINGNSHDYTKGFETSLKRVLDCWSTTMQCVRLFTFLLRCGPEAAIFVASKMAATIEKSNGKT
jgi:hypothetical protein